jgi:hypothetical protein
MGMLCQYADLLMRKTAAFFPNIRFLVVKGFSRNIAYEPVFPSISHPLVRRWQDLPAVKQAYIELARYYIRQWRQKIPEGENSPRPLLTAGLMRRWLKHTRTFLQPSLYNPFKLECNLIEHRYRLAFWILSQIPRLRALLARNQ